MRRLLTLLLCLFSANAFGEENPHVRLKTTEGEILLQLNAAKAPITTHNFIKYVEKGHYDNTVFHRVIPNFMIQGGGFTAEAAGLEQKPTAAPIKNEGQNGLKNLRGTIAMARTNDPDSATAQFFINVVDNPNLDYPSYGGYAVFGEVVEGMDVVDKIRNVPTGRQNLTSLTPSGQTFTRPAPNVPNDDVVIKSARVEMPEAVEPDESPDAISKGDDTAFNSMFFFIPLLAFTLGSIPFGLLIAKSQGVNIREHGSGNIGATNVWRTLGKKFGIPCLILDALKGFVPVVLVINLIQIEGRGLVIDIPFPDALVMSIDPAHTLITQVLHILTALFAVLGHNYSPWVGFKGGKGIATSAGVFLALIPVATLILLVLFVVLLFTTRYVSVASVLTSCALPLIVLWGSSHHGRLQDGSWNKPLFILAVLIAVMATWKHRSNFKRLMEGTETRFTTKSKSKDHG